MANLKLEPVSGSTKRVSFAAHVLSMWAGELYPKTVLVPAAIVNELISFDFKKTIDMTPELKGLTEVGIQTLVNVMLREFIAVKDSNIKDILKERSFGDIVLDARDGKTIKLDSAIMTQLSDQLVKQATQSGLTTLFLRDALMKGIKDNNINKTAFSFANITASLVEFQKVYGELTALTPAAELTPKIADTVATIPSLKFIYSMLRGLRDSQAPAISARLSYVVDNIMSHTMGSPFVQQEEVIPGLEYKLSTTEWVSDLNFETALSGYIILLRSYMGFSSPFESASMTPIDLVNQLVTNASQLVPVLPANMLDKVNVSFLTDDLIPRLWGLFVIKRITGADPSITSSRAKSLMDFRKYKSDEYTAALEEFLEVMGYAVDAFLDVAAYLRDVAMADRLYFPGHAKDRKIYTEFINQILEPYKTFSVNMQHPRFIKEGAHVISHQVGVSVKDFTPIIKSADYSMTNAFMMSLESSERREFRHTAIVEGSILNIKTPMNLTTYMQLSTTYRPSYAQYLTTSNFLNDHELFKTSLGIINLNDLVKRSSYWKEHLKRGQLKYVMNVDDLASLLSLPYVIASSIFSEPGMYWVADSLSEALFVLSGSDYFYYDLLEADTTRRIPPFVAQHPFFLELSTELGIDKPVDKIKTDLPVNIEITKKKDPKNPRTKPVEVNVSTEEDSEEEVMDDGSLETSIATDAESKEARLKDKPTEAPKSGFKWIFDSKTKSWIQTPIKGKKK